MGFDIYFCKVKEKFDTDANERDVHSFANEEYGKKMRRAFHKAAKALYYASISEDRETYNETYMNEIKGLFPLSQYPFITLETLGVSYDFSTNVYSFSVLSFAEFLDRIDNVMDKMYPPCLAHFRNVYFIDNFFDGIGTLQDNFAIAEKSDLEELVHLCEMVLNDHDKAKALLPMRYYSTYDEYYFDGVQQCKEKVCRILDELGEDETIYIDFG